MKRGVGVFLILVFWLGPLAAVLQANTESRLPACCRRHGAHRCAMAGEASESSASQPASPFVGSPSHCPRFPAAAPASTASLYAVAASALLWPGLAAQALTAAVSASTAFLPPLRSHTVRGPPTSLLG